MHNLHLHIEFDYCIDELDFAYSGWREDSSILLTIKDHLLIDTLAISFFERNPSWMDEVVPAAITFQLQWLCDLFGYVGDDRFVEETRNTIFRYICGAVVSGLLDWESNRDVGVDYD